MAIARPKVHAPYVVILLNWTPTVELSGVCDQLQVLHLNSDSRT